MNESRFPAEQWERVDPASQQMNGAAIERAADFIADQRPATRSLLVIRNGVLVFERYFNVATASTLQPIASVTKTVIGALVGIAIQHGHLKGPEQPLVDIFPELRPIYGDSPRRRLTLGHLLSLTDGWKFDEDDPNEPVQQSNTPARFMLEQYPLAHEPGTHFNYNTISTQIVSHALTRVTGHNALEYAKRTLFKDLAIGPVEWPILSEGDAMGGGGLKMRPADLAKIGLLYLRSGTWRERRLIPQTYVNASTQPHSAGGPPIGLPYGYCMWIGELGGHRAWMGLGFRGQRLAMLPDVHSIIVSTNQVDGAARGLDGRDLGPMVREWYQ